MKNRWRNFLGVFVLVLMLTGAVRADDAAAGKGIAWQPWGDAAFVQAKREHKFVLLDLHAVWCHWCHVMDVTTYSDPKVIALIQAHYVAVGVDQDSRPDLANRYQDYGWPATVVFNADGSEIVKRQGYIPPERMASMLQAIIDDPTPGPSVTNAKAMTFTSAPDLADAGKLQQQLADGYDHKLGSWGRAQKFLNWDNVEYCLVRAQTGDAEAEAMARQTLIAQRQIIDPVWGGVDQYSAGDDWDHPHFEKVMQFQAENMRIYALAYALWQQPEDLKTAEGIYHYVRNFLTSPDGVVYTSQDADVIDGEHAGDYFKLDDAGRRKLGLPRVDTHIYARENGWFIVGLTALYSASGDIRYRDEAVRAADWIREHRGIAGGGFHHGEETTPLISLGDSLAMGRAYLSLYAVTADHIWLDRAEETAGFIADHFTYKVGDKSVGFATAGGEATSALFAPTPDFDENVVLARFANLLGHYTGNPRDRAMAESSLHFVGAPALAESRLSSVGGLLLAEKELAGDPLHIAIVGAKSDPLAAKLFATAVAFPSVYKQVEWIEGHSSGTGPDAIQYPVLSTAAAYTCAQGACSAPTFDAEKLAALLKRRASH
jgi:uncharacterized protein YyaL (SSP411 family)